MNYWIETSGHSNEILPIGLVDLDVPLSNVVLVLPQGQVPVLSGLKPDECLTIPSSLGTQAEGHTPSGMFISIYFSMTLEIYSFIC